MAERMMSPCGGFLIQSRAGSTGNFEVVIAWPDGGLAHYFRDNDNPTFPWRGPHIFGRGHYRGASVMESDFKSHPAPRLGNLEVMATAATQELHYYWRDNGGAFLWHGPAVIGSGVAHTPSLAYAGWQRTQPKSFHAVVGRAGKGLRYMRRNNASGHLYWEEEAGMGNEHYQGAAMALTTMGAYSMESKWSETGPGGAAVAAAVCSAGYLHLFMDGVTLTPQYRTWYSTAVIGEGVFPDMWGQFRGRPSVLQGSFNQKDPPAAFGYGHYGNLELIVPHRDGGFYHFWKLCGLPAHDVEPIGWGWGGPVRVAGPHYDEVSMIQSGFSRTRHGNLEVIAHTHGQRGFDFYWRDEQFTWHGPFTVG